MSCMNCKECIFTDDGETMQFKCVAKTKKGKQLTYHMHTGKFVNGIFKKDTIEAIKEKMENTISRRKEPWWCPKREES